MIQYFEDKSEIGLSGHLTELERDSSVTAIMVLACDANNYDPGELTVILKKCKKPVFGGIFPGIIFNKNKYDTGFILVSLKSNPVINVVDNISNLEKNLDEEIVRFSDLHFETKTMIVFIDGFTKRIKAFIESLFTIYGLEFNYIGGGAGSLSLKQKPCIITNQGLKEDCAVMVGLNQECGIGVQHGWEPVAGPFKVTSAYHNSIKKLDFKPAWEVYKKAVEEHYKKEFTKDNFFQVAKAYPFGINKIDSQIVVRDPLILGDDDSLHCVGEVENGSYVDILTGNKKTLLNGAGQAVNLALECKHGDPEEFILLVDCISRVLFLESDYKDELEEIISKCDKVPLVGVLSVGEIANSRKDYLEFYNKTTVIGCF